LTAIGARSIFNRIGTICGERCRIDAFFCAFVCTGYDSGDDFIIDLRAALLLDRVDNQLRALYAITVISITADAPETNQPLFVVLSK